MLDTAWAGYRYSLPTSLPVAGFLIWRGRTNTCRRPVSCSCV